MKRGNIVSLIQFCLYCCTLIARVATRRCEIIHVISFAIYKLGKLFLVCNTTGYPLVEYFGLAIVYLHYNFRQITQSKDNNAWLFLTQCKNALKLNMYSH
jgi:hypothetical protein